MDLWIKHSCNINELFDSCCNFREINKCMQILFDSFYKYVDKVCGLYNNGSGVNNVVLELSSDVSTDRGVKYINRKTQTEANRQTDKQKQIIRKTNTDNKTEKQIDKLINRQQVRQTNILIEI